MMIRKSKPVLADFMTVVLLSKDCTHCWYGIGDELYKHSEEVYHTISFKMACFFFLKLET